MRNVELKNDPAQQPPANFDLSTFSDRTFDLFKGQLTDVTLNCKAYTINDLIEVFGTNFHIQKASDDRFISRIRVDAGPAFYAWVFGFGGDISIVEPAWVRDEFQAMLAAQN